MSLFPDISALVEKRREFSEERILGFSREQVYDVVADLNRCSISLRKAKGDLCVCVCVCVCPGTKSSCHGARSLAIPERVQGGAMASCPLDSLLCWRDILQWFCTIDPLPFESVPATTVMTSSVSLSLSHTHTLSLSLSRQSQQMALCSLV